MALIIRMPALSPTMESGTLTKWLVEPGKKVQPGDFIAEIETDKAVMEVESVDEGIIEKLLIEEGQKEVKVNAPIAVILEEGEDVSAIDELDLSFIPERKTASSTDEIDQTKALEEASQIQSITTDLVSSNDLSLDTENHKMAQDIFSKTEPSYSILSSSGVIEQDPVLDQQTKWVSTTLRDALRDAMAEEMRRDPEVFVMGEEVAEYQGAYKVTQELLQEFGEKRVIDTPITEHGFAGLGVGAAFAGLKPIVEFMTMNFAMQAIDHLVNSAAKTLYMSGGQMGCPIVFRGPNGAAARVAAQHSQDYSSWYAHIPGLIVLSPYDSADAKGLLKAAIRSPNPVIFLENELLYGESFDVPVYEDWVLPIGKAKIRHFGRDVTITAHSRMVGLALQAAKKLSEENISIEVIDLRSLRPLDTDTVIQSVMKTNRFVSVEEGWGRCGIGSELVSCVTLEAFDYLDSPPLRVHQQDVPLPYAENLEALSLPNINDIIKAVKAVLYMD